MKKWKRGGVALAAAVALCASLGAGSAFAVGTTTLDGTANWEVPTYSITNTVWKDADGNVVAEGTEGATQYKVITTWAEAWATSGADYLGISNSAYYGNGGNGNPRVETYVSAAYNTTVGVWATAANENPNAYNWNMFYNLYADALGLDLSDWASTVTATNGGADWSSEAGVWCGFKYRPEIVSINNNLSSSAALTYIEQIRNGQYSATATSSGGTYAPDAEEDGSYDTSFRIEGDETYDPQIIQLNRNDPYSFVASAYVLAEMAEQVIADTAGLDGLSDGETLDWRTVNQLPRSNRYSETPTECALNIERLAKGSVYYALAMIDEGVVEKKTVAYVAYPWEYSGGSITTSTTQVVVAVYDYTENIGTGPMDGRASWTPLAVNQLSTDVVAQEKNIPNTVSQDYVGASDPSTTSFTLYYADADDLATVDVVYCSPNVGKTATELQEWIETNASSDSAAARASEISYLADWPCITNGSNHTMEKLIYGAFGMDFIYPELFPSMQLSSYWCDVIYHLTDSSLASAMSWIYSTATLPDGVDLSNIPSRYNAERLVNKFNQGLEYYLSTVTYEYDDEGEVLAESDDETINRVLNNIALDGTTTFDGEVDGEAAELEYAFNGFEPTETWTGSLEEVSFTDMPTEDWWSHGYIVSAVRMGLMTGYRDDTGALTGYFGPSDSLTRAQAIVVIYRAMTGASDDEAYGTDETGFTDVDASNYYTNALNWAVENEIVTGDQDSAGEALGTFRPNDELSRQEMALMVWRAAGSPAASDLSAYELAEDAGTEWEVSVAALQWTAEQDILSGSVLNEGTDDEEVWLYPSDSTTREQAAKIFVESYGFLE